MKIEQAKALQLEASINRDEEVRRAGRRSGFPWLIGGAAATAAGIAWFAFPHSEQAKPISTPLQTSPRPTETDVPQSAFTTAGYIEPVPPFPVKITPLVPGRIDEFPVREGDPVKAGDVIARMNTGLHEKRADELRAAAGVNSQRLALAERELTRVATLSSRGASTGRDLDQATAEVRILRAESEKLSAELASVEWQIEQSTVRSPVDGVLYQRTASEGDFMNLDERHEVASIIDPARLQVWTDVNQREVARLGVGANATVSLDAEPGREFRARVDRILPRASLAKNTVRCILRLDESSPALRPDMSVKVTFEKP